MWYVLRRLGAFDSADYIYKLDVYNDLDIFINLQVLSYTRITSLLKFNHIKWMALKYKIFQSKDL